MFFCNISIWVLNQELARYLDITAKGSFMHKTPTKGREILDQILENTFIIDVHKAEGESSPMEPSSAKSKSLNISSLDFAVETSLEP